VGYRWIWADWSPEPPAKDEGGASDWVVGKAPLPVWEAGRSKTEDRVFVVFVVLAWVVCDAFQNIPMLVSKPMSSHCVPS
jgi:hypothetical protein